MNLTRFVFQHSHRRFSASIVVWASAVLLLASGCTEPEKITRKSALEVMQEQTRSNLGLPPERPKLELETLANGEPNYVTIQHVLIAFKGTGTEATRSKEDAEKLANEILERAQNGEDFAGLVKQNSDDSGSGTYTMANHGERDFQSSVPNQAVFARTGMVPGFGNVGFVLDVDEVGIANFDKKDSPYGWHIIKRLK